MEKFCKVPRGKAATLCLFDGANDDKQDDRTNGGHHQLGDQSIRRETQQRENPAAQNRAVLSGATLAHFAREAMVRPRGPTFSLQTDNPMRKLRPFLFIVDYFRFARCPGGIRCLLSD
jgi:hypothetical protein